MNDTTRKIMGLVFGLITGLAYGLVAQMINPIFLRGIPLFYTDPPVTGILFTTITAGVVGLITAWPEDGIPGVLFGSLAGALLTTLLSLRGMSGGMEFYAGLFVLLVMTFLPRAFIFLPVAGLIRWVLAVWAEEFRSIQFSVRKLVLSLFALIVFVGLVGTLSLYSSYARESLAKTNQLVQAGMQAEDTDSLPEPLKKVTGFTQAARGAYTLELTDNPDILPIQRPIAPPGAQEYGVIIRFDNGFRFGCTFTLTFPEPSCGLY